MTVKKARRLELESAPVRADDRAIAEAFEERTISGAHGVGVPVRIYRPAATTPAGVVLWLHGGGFVLGSLELTDSRARALAAASSSVVVSVGYRLAPEWRFPHGLDDCYEVLRWASLHRASLAGDGCGVAIVGESAGANLAAAVTLLAAQRRDVEIDFQALICPMVCRAFDVPSRRYTGPTVWPTPDAITWCWDQYVDAGVAADEPLVSPLLAASLEGLPPALVITCQYDALRDEGEAYADRLRHADVPTETVRFPDLVHGLFEWADVVPTAADGVRRLGEGVRAALTSVRARAVA